VPVFHIDKGIITQNKGGGVFNGCVSEEEQKTKIKKRMRK